VTVKIKKVENGLVTAMIILCVCLCMCVFVCVCVCVCVSKSGKVKGNAQPSVTMVTPALLRCDGDRCFAPLAHRRRYPRIECIYTHKHATHPNGDMGTRERMHAYGHTRAHTCIRRAIRM